MTGDEIITISIENKDKKLSTSYSILQADSFNIAKGEFHLMQLDKLVEKFNNNNNTIKQILETHKEAIKNCEGVYSFRELDLDVSIPDFNSFSLWLDGDTKVKIDVPVNIENASMIQSVIRDLGREVMHSWSQQYSIKP